MRVAIAAAVFCLAGCSPTSKPAVAKKPSPQTTRHVPMPGPAAFDLHDSYQSLLWFRDLVETKPDDVQRRLADLTGKRIAWWMYVQFLTEQTVVLKEVQDKGHGEDWFGIEVWYALPPDFGCEPLRHDRTEWDTKLSRTNTVLVTGTVQGVECKALSLAKGAKKHRLKIRLSEHTVKP